MRILFLTNFYPPVRSYGYTQWCYEVAENLQSRGHSVAVLTSHYCRETVPPGEEGIYRRLHLQTSDLNYYRPLDFLLHHRRQEGENRAALQAVLTHFAPDILFVWGMWNLARAVPFHAEQRCCPPVVYFISDLWPASPDIHAAYWDARPRHLVMQPLKQLLRQVAWRLLAREGWPHPLRFEHAICVSHYIRETLIAAGLPLQEAAVIHGGTDLARFRRTLAVEQAVGSGPLELLYAGQLAEHKGVHTAIEAMARLQGWQLPRPIRLTLVGAGHPGYTAQLQRQVAEAGLQDQVLFWGAVAREEMSKVLARHDILVFPSTGPEALPRMVEEGMAAKLVVVGTTTGGTGEILVDGENGLTFIPGDAEGLARQIKRIASDPALIYRLAEAGHRTVLERFTLDRMVDEIEGYLLSVVDPATREQAAAV